MALTGTLKDFGIADILQLIGQQRKTGVLNVEDEGQSVQVHFVDGRIVRATTAARNRQDLLGTMMVRAGILTEAKLEQALSVQKRTLRRLGDVLVGEGMVEKKTFREMHQLQTTETVYKLFRWKNGTYAFEQQDVDYDPDSIEPIDSENALMEGFRMIDEWPMVRKRISSYEMTFRRVVDSESGDSEEVARRAADLGEYARKVYQLADEGVTVQRIIDLSRLGEFEACKALGGLVEKGYLEPRAAPRSARKLGGKRSIDVGGTLRRAIAQLAVGAAVLAGVGVLSYLALGSERGMADVFVSRGAQHVIAEHAQARIDTAITIHRLETGANPETLHELVEAGLLTDALLEYPYSGEWFYRVAEGEPRGYLLLSPIP